MSADRPIFSVDGFSVRWRELERDMVRLEGQIGKRDLECHTGSARWIEGLHRRHAGKVFPKNKVLS